MPTPPNPTKRDFIFHVALLLFVAGYFASLLWWFGGIFATGAGAAHATMTIVLPIVIVIGVVALLTLSSIAWEGRRQQLATASEGAAETSSGKGGSNPHPDAED